MGTSIDEGDYIRSRYAGGAPIAQIQAETGCSKATIYYWVDGGPASGPMHREPLPRRRGGPTGRDRRLGRGSREALVRRLWRTAEAQVRDIEERLLKGGMAPDERERDARVLAVLAKTLRELVAFDTTQSKLRPRSAAEDDDVPADTNVLRERLARKIEAVVAAQDGEPAGQA